MLRSLALSGKVFPCIQRATTYGNVCVCNSTYCDTVPSVLNLTSGEYQWYTTSADQLGFNSTSGKFTNSTSTTTNATITVPQLNLTRQTIVGFGGAFTDATGINVLKLSEASQTNWLKAYFGDEGIEYSVGRVPIGATDYSVREYSYCDDEDESLESFSLQSEDLLYKIPLIQNATQLRGNGSLSLFASAWTAPTWMKTNKTYSGMTSVQDEYLDLWAQYYLKFFDAYQENNISFWGVTTQNQPLKTYFGSDIPNNSFNSTKMKKWIKESLGPAIRNSSYSDLKIILHDDDRSFLPNLQWTILYDEDVVSYADGIGFHWYSDYMTSGDYFRMIETKVGNTTKELFRIGTEAANGWLYELGQEASAVELGSWTRAERYISNIIQDLSHNFVGWVEWNLALNTTGGAVSSSGDYINRPGLDSPTIVNATSDEFYKQPSFYVVGHFSKFVVPGSQRIFSTTDGDDISSLAFLRPDGKIAVVIDNTSSASQTVTLEILEQTEVFTVSANSINTILYSV